MKKKEQEIRDWPFGIAGHVSVAVDQHTGSILVILLLLSFFVYVKVFLDVCNSGDTDGRVPAIGTRYCVEAVGLPLKARWRSWYHHHQVFSSFSFYQFSFSLPLDNLQMENDIFFTMTYFSSSCLVIFDFKVTTKEKGNNLVPMKVFVTFNFWKV